MAEYSSSSGSYTTTLYVTETSVGSASDNNSIVTFSLVLTKNKGSGLWHYDSTCPWSININGTSYSGKFSYDFRNYSSLTLKSNTTQSIPHNADGTKSISVSASVNMDNSDYVSIMSPSGTLTLTTILRNPRVEVHNGSGWVSGKPYVHNGSGWVEAKEVYVHNGSNWVATTDRGS